MNLTDIDTFGTAEFDAHCCLPGGPFGSLEPRYAITRTSDRKPFIEWPSGGKGEYLYFVQFWQIGTCPFPWNGRVKIGRTHGPASRWKSILGIADGLMLPLGFAQNSGHFEREMHLAFRPWHSHGEWFRPSQELAWLAVESDGGFLAARGIDEIRSLWEQSGRRWADPCPHYHGMYESTRGRNLWG